MFFPDYASFISLPKKESKELEGMSDDDLKHRALSAMMGGATGVHGIAGSAILGALSDSNSYFQELERRNKLAEDKKRAAEYEASLPLEERIALNTERDRARRAAMPQQTQVFTGTYGPSRAAMPQQTQIFTDTYGGRMQQQAPVNAMRSNMGDMWRNETVRPMDQRNSFRQTSMGRPSWYSGVRRIPMGDRRNSLLPNQQESQMGGQDNGPRYSNFISSLIPRRNAY